MGQQQSANEVPALGCVRRPVHRLPLPPPPPLPQSAGPLTRRTAAGAALLFVGATLGFTSVFNGVGAANKTAPRPYRVVKGRVFVSTSSGAVLAVRRAPRDPRTFVLVGDAGSYALRIKKGVDIRGVSDDELLTRVFTTSGWEAMLEALEPGSREEGGL